MDIPSNGIYLIVEILANQNNGTHWIVEILETHLTEYIGLLILSYMVLYCIILYYIILFCIILYYGIMVLWYYGIMVYIVFYKLFVCRGRRKREFIFRTCF